MVRSVHSLAKETCAEVSELKYGGKGNAAPPRIPFSLEPGGDGWSQSSHLVTMKEKPREQLRAGRNSGSCLRQSSASNPPIRSTPTPPKYTCYELDFLLFRD